MVVVPDRCGQREEALQDADGDAGGGAAAVPFQVELALEGVVDRLDDLPQWFEQRGPGAFGLALASGPQQVDAQVEG